MTLRARCYQFKCVQVFLITVNKDTSQSCYLLYGSNFPFGTKQGACEGCCQVEEPNLQADPGELQASRAANPGLLYLKPIKGNLSGQKAGRCISSLGAECEMCQGKQVAGTRESGCEEHRKRGELAFLQSLCTCRGGPGCLEYGWRAYLKLLHQKYILPLSINSSNNS